ncbi:MAG: DinB family protein [Verrucomicrobiota bacterium]
MSATTEPQLDAPGAGLPAPELFIARKLFAVKCRTGSREAFIRKFREERAAIRQLIERFPEAQRSEQVLIRRLRGLEDSSRHWSLWMTLDHLRIVNVGIGDFIVELTAGRSPEEIIGTADVKPDPTVGVEVEQAYEESCDHLLEIAGARTELKTDATYPHPWFGPMDAFRWLALASMHMGIHRAQAEAILEGLPR